MYKYMYFQLGEVLHFQLRMIVRCRPASDVSPEFQVCCNILRFWTCWWRIWKREYLINSLDLRGRMLSFPTSCDFDLGVSSESVYHASLVGYPMHDGHGHSSRLLGLPDRVRITRASGTEGRAWCPPPNRPGTSKNISIASLQGTNQRS
jgi:hypothetical protein